ncbi:MAG: peptidase M16 domain-containing protein [Halothiobacillaceae bacterium]|nr:MAG: peptidase M16 domain-containing protein [Halothiobacillaceae bacterium]
MFVKLFASYPTLHRVGALIGIALLIQGCSSNPALQGHTVTTPQTPTIQHWQTSNGANVFFVAAPELPMVDLRVVFDAGSARDGDKPALALLTNGLLAEGAGVLNATEIAKRFEDLGARFSNGSYRDMAVVSLRSLADSELLNAASDTFALLLADPTFPEESLARESRRLLVALRAEEESLDSLSDNAFYKAIYNDHPYAQSPMGTAESINGIKRDDLKAFYQQHYVARNAVLAIVGSLSRKEAEFLANKVSPGEAAQPLVMAPALASAQTIKIEHPSQQTHIVMGQPGIERKNPDYFPLYVGNHILGGSGLVSRLSEEIREKRGLSYSTYSYFNPMAVNGPYTLGLQTRNDQASEAIKLLDTVLRNYINEGPTKEELQAAKQNITGNYPLRIASNSKIVEYLAAIGFYGLPLDYLERFNDNVNAVTLEQIRDAFQRHVNPDTMVTVIAGGESRATTHAAP